MKKRSYSLISLVLSITLIFSSFAISFAMSEQKKSEKYDQQKEAETDSQNNIIEEKETKEESMDYIIEEKVVVKYKNGTTTTKMKGINASFSTKSSTVNSKEGVGVLEFSSSSSAESAVDKLRKDPSVELVEPLYIYEASSSGGGGGSSDGPIEVAVVNDPGFVRKWQWGLDAINVYDLWEEVDVSNRTATAIAIIDTGVDLDHPDLEDSIITGYDFVNEDKTPDDDDGHGTHVAGIAAAISDNGIGVAGVAGGVEIMPVKVLDEHGKGNSLDIYLGIRYAVDEGADVINLSLGGPYPSLLVKQAIDYAVENDVVVVAAIGNDNDTVDYPAAFSGVIGVGAVDWNDSKDFTKANFSNWGAQVDLVAPGVDIYSTDLEGSYSLKSGTSMATPFVAGYAALLKADDSSLSCDEILDIMEDNAYDLGDSEYFGEGLINLDDFNDIRTPIWYRHLELAAYKVSNTEYNIIYELLDYKYEISDEDGTYYLYLGEFENDSWISQPRTLAAIEVNSGPGNIGYDFSDQGAGTYGLYMMDPNNRFLQSDIKEITVNPTVTFNISLPDGEVASENGFEGKIYFDGYDVKTFYINSGENTFTDEIEVLLGSYTIYAVIEDKENDLYYDTIFYNDENQQTETYYEGIEEDLQTHITSDKTINIEFKAIQHQEDGISDDLENAVNRGSKFTITDAIDYYGDIDFVEITLDSKDYYCASFTNTNIDLEVTLYDDTGEWIKKYSGYQDIYFSDIDLWEGTYYLSIAGDLDTEMGPYTLEFKSVEDDYDETFEDAAVIELDTSISGGIDFSKDVDTFKFSITEEGNYIIRSYGNTDTFGAVFNSDKVLVADNDDVYYDEDDDAGDLNFYIEEYLTVEDYYLDVSGYESEMGKYSIKVITDDYRDDFDTEHNINIGSTVSAAINDVYDSDMFSFTISEPGIYTMTSDNALDTRAALFNNNKEFITSNDNNEDNVGFKIVENLKEGKHYLKVEGYETGNYQISVKGDTEAITFNDANLEAAIREVLGFEDDEDIYSMDCLEIEVLDLSNKGIKDISDLSYFKNLLTVDLSNNQITTIPTLDSGSLWALDLNNNQITDISGISSLNTLGELYLSNNNISDISALSEMDLVFLMINSNNISDITSLQNQNDLKVLYMKDNNITDFSPISSYYSNLEDKDFIIANNVSISGTKKVGKTLTVSYTYSVYDDAEQGSTYRWLASSSSNGEYTEINGATSKTYKLTSNEQGKYIKAEVTPKSNANEIGFVVTSSPVGPIAKEESSSPGGGSGGGDAPANNDTSKEVEKNSDGKSTLTVKPAEGDTTIDATWKEDIDEIDVVIPQEIFDTALEKKKSVVIETNKVKMEIPTEVVDEEGEVSLGITELSLEDIKVELDEAFTNVNEDALVFDFDFSVDGKNITKFNEPLTITIDFDTTKVEDTDKLGVYYYNESEKTWEYVGGKVNEDGKITFTIDHFSKYAVMEYNKTFEDIQNHWAKKQIEIMASKHITKGITEDSFAPEKVTTRAEFTTWLVRALDLDVEKTEKIFDDVTEDEWFFGPINKAYEVGIINGVEKNVFAPQKQITREEMASLIMRAYEYSTGTNLNTIITTQEVRFRDMDDASSWAARNITLANALGLISGYVDGTFKPAKSTTRAEAMAVISRLVNEIE